MNRTKIEWADFTWNPVVGCKNGCWYCYARKIRKRFNPDIPFEQIVNYDERLNDPLKVKKPSRIFVGSMTDLFASWMPAYNMKYIMETVRKCPQHTFIFLTKSPLGYRQIRKYPKNCWLGISVESGKNWYRAAELRGIEGDNIKFISIEPILGEIDTGYFSLFDWVIIGGLTPRPAHEQKWITDFLRLNKRFKLPIFLKDNLKYHKKIQQFPKEAHSETE